jgi:hypothetical protein
LVLAGCNLEPKYPFGATAYDPGLTGRWAFQGEPERDGKPGPITIVEFRPRTIPVIDGRLRPDKPLAVEPGQTAPPPNAYTLIIPDEATGRTQEVGAFLLKLGEVRLLGMQWTGGVGGGGLFLYPLHHFMRYERSDDRLTLGLPRCDVVWMPAAQPLDAPEKAKPVPTLAELDGRSGAGMFVTFDIDRTLEVYRQLGVEPAFWRPESLKGARLAPDAPAANP